MAGNIYDDAIEQLPTTPAVPTNIYDDVIKSQEAGRQQSLRTSLTQAGEQSPDSAAEAATLSQQTGVPLEIVQRDLPAYKKRAQIVNTPYTAMITDTPVLANWASDPANAAVSHDDMEPLGALEWLVSMPSRAISQSLNEQAYGELRAKSLFQPLTQAEQDQLSSYKLHATAGGELGAGNSWFRGSLTKTMKLLATLTAPESIPAAAGAVGGAILGSIAGAPAGLEIPGAIAGGKLGFTAGYTYGLGKSAFQTAAASSYDEYLGLTDAVGRKLDPDVAKAAALVNGAVNAGLMVFGGKVIAAGMEAGGQKIAAQLTKNTIKEALRQPSVAGAISEMVKSYGTTLTEGTALMVAMKAADIITASTANAAGGHQPIAGQIAPGNIDLFAQPAVTNADGSISTVDSFSVNVDGKEVLLPTVMPDGRHMTPDAALEAFKQTGKNLGTFDSPAAATAFAQQLHEDYAAGKYSQPSVGRQLLAAAGEGVQAFALIGLAGPAMGLARNIRSAQRASRGAQFFEALGEGVAQSKTIERLPESAQRFLEKATQDGPVATLYAPIEQWSKYWQDRNVDPEAMATEVTGSKDAYERARATGEDLAIPTARYATKLAGTEHNAFFAQELRLGPDEMNAREAQQLIADVKAGKSEPAPEAAASPVRTAVLEQLTAAGVPEQTAQQYAALHEAAFGTMAERAGVDPAQLYEQYGLKVSRPDLEPAGGTGGPGGAGTPPAAGEPGGPGAIGPAGGAQPPPLSGRATEPPVGAPAEVVRAAGDLSGPAGAVHDVLSAGVDPAIAAAEAAMRSTALPAGTKDRLREAGYTPAQIDAMNVGQADAALRSTMAAGQQVPGARPVGDYAAADLAHEAQRVAAMAGARRAEKGPRATLVDRKSDAAQNPESYLNAETRNAPAAQEGVRPADVAGQQSRADVVGTQQGRGDGHVAEPGGPAPRGIPAIDEVFAKEPAAATDARLTPEVERNLRWVLEELQNFPHQAATWHWLTDENAARGKSGNAAGGSADRRPAVAGAPVYDDVVGYSPVNEKTVKGEKVPAREARGTRNQVEAAIEKLLETRHVTSNLMEGALRVAENRNAGNWHDLERPMIPPPWGAPVERAFTDALSTSIDEAGQPGNMLADQGLEQDAIDTGGPGDTSFNIDEFSQSLFDALEPPDPTADNLTEKTDTLDTGEMQPRLPGAGAVRDSNVATPQLEAPFSLTSEVGTPAKGKQTSLFQGEPLTQQTLDTFAAGVKDRFGDDLSRFQLGLNRNGDIALEWIMVDRGAQRAGIGSEVMRDLTRYADANGRRIVLSPAEDGGSTRARLIKFYKRFGFVENTGRERDFSTRAGMYRDPSSLANRDLGQPFYHGTPHDFERFRLQHVGTGQGAASYGWGLYFAENPAVAADYHDQLSGGRDVVAMKIGRLRLRGPEFDYTRNAHINDVENIRAAIAEDLLASPLDLNAQGEAGFRDHVLAMVDRRIADYKTEYPAGVKAAEKLRAELEKPGALSVEFTKTPGGIYQVDIPDEHVANMLNWDAPLEEQPEAVRKLFPVDADGMVSLPNGEKDVAGLIKGDDLYSAVTEAHAGGQKEASLWFAEHGVPGLKYLDQQSRDNAAQESDRTRNVVAFDESIVTLTHKDGKPFTPAERKEFFQSDKTIGEPGPPAQRRGVIRFGPDRQFSVDLLERADLSTFLHESGHFFLEVFGDLADKLQAIAPEQLTDEQKHLLSDYGTLLQALGVENRREVGVPQHEAFARQFEAYLMKGEAPSLALRTPFARFRAWLTGIYRSLTNLNVRLTPEVRGVMDRLLASDQAIKDAEAQRGVEAMFTTPESAGMDPAEFGLYARTVADASKDAREQLDRKLLTEVHREQTATWREQRATIRADVEDGVRRQPEYQAISAMRDGTLPDGAPLVEGLETPPLVLSRKILEERFGKDRIRRLPRGIIGTEGGLDPDVVAGMYGYSSADALLTAVEKAPPITRVIDQETQRRMIEQHGSILLDGTLPERAQAAVANETRDAVIRAEMRALGRKRREVAPFVKAERAKGEAALADAKAERDYERRWFEAEAKLRIAIAEGHKQVEIDALTKEVRTLKAQARGGAAVIRNAIPDAETLKAAAEARISAMTIREMQPQQFWSASRRAGQQALDRAARQDFDGAITAKQQELINLNLYRQSEAALEDVEARVRFAQDLGRPAARKIFGLAGQSYLDQVDGILDRFDFAKVSQKVLDRRGALSKFVASLEAQGLPVDMPEELLDESRRRNYKELTIDELRGVTDGLKELQHLARLKNRLLRRAEQRELDTVAGSVADSVRAHFTGSAPVGERDRRPQNERARMMGDFFGSHRKMASLARELDGFQDGGPMWEQIIRPLNEAGSREAVMQSEATKAMSVIVERAYPKSDKRLLYEKTEIPEVGASMSRMERLAIALNWGNEGNRDRIRKGEGWKDDQVQAILDTLDARDLRFVQDVFDHINSYWPETAAKQERIYGVAPEKVDPVPIKAKAGEIDGGYYPLKYDERMSAKVGGMLDYEAGNLSRAAAYGQSTTKRGHTKERVSNVKLPVRRDFGVIFEHVTQVIHDLTHHEALIDVGRVLAHPDVQKAIYQTHGDQVYRQFKNGVRDVAIGQAPATNAFERALSHVRQGATVAGLGWSLSTAMLHLSSALPRAIVRIGPEYVARGLVRWTRDALSMENTAKWIDESSAMMRTRGLTQQREINEIRNAVGVNTGKFSGWISEIVDKTSFGTVGKQGLVDSYFYLVQQAQRIADIPTWLGQYEKSTQLGEAHDRAVALADQAVLDAFGGGQNKDLAAVQRGGPLLRLWTNFYSPFNVTYNLTVEATRRARFNEPGSLGRLAVDYLMLYSVPAVLGMTIHGALKANGKAASDDASTIAADVLKAHAAYAADTMLGFRELSGAIEGYYGYEGPAGARLFAATGKVIAQAEHSAAKVYEGKSDEAFGRAFWLSLNDAGGVIFHYPSGQAGRTIDGIAAMVEGKTDNPGALIVGAPRVK